MHDTQEYCAIQAFYGNRTAKRSGVRLMNHIDEGLAVMEAIGAYRTAKRAFCLHPLFQADSELTTVGLEYLAGAVDGHPIMLAMEYRQWANAFLANKVTINLCDGAEAHFINTEPCFITGAGPTPGPLSDVRDMLIADKVQNRKDFERHHKGIHARSIELDYYFKLWLSVLGISEGRYQELCKVMN